MTPITWAAIYIMIWWMTFFTILPLWNRTPTEEGEETVKGHDTGAPITHNLWKKVRLNSLVALGIWLVLMLILYIFPLPLPEIKV